MRKEIAVVDSNDFHLFSRQFFEQCARIVNVSELVERTASKAVINHCLNCNFAT